MWTSYENIYLKKTNFAEEFSSEYILLYFVKHFFTGNLLGRNEICFSFTIVLNLLDGTDLIELIFN